MSSVLNTYTRKPISFAKGKGSYLYTENGDKYLTWVMGIATNLIGHSNEYLLKAIQEQSKKLIHISTHLLYQVRKIGQKVTDNTLPILFFLLIREQNRSKQALRLLEHISIKLENLKK
jgi:acetylornithine/N-succinyldiaminopimelate aminotransferase